MISLQRTKAIFSGGQIVFIGLIMAVFIFASIGTARAEGLIVKNNTRHKIHVEVAPDTYFCSTDKRNINSNSSFKIDLIFCFIDRIELNVPDAHWPTPHDVVCTLKVNGTERAPSYQNHLTAFNRWINYRWSNVKSGKLSAFQELECVDHYVDR